jgi:hypothetical protein
MSSIEKSKVELLHELQLLKLENESIKIAFQKDMEEHKLTEAALRLSEENFRMAFENNSTAILVVEPDTTISMINKETCKISGYSDSELLGMSWTKFLHQDDLQCIMEYNQIKLFNINESSQNYEVRMITKSGEFKNVLLSVAVLRNDKIIATLINISERKNAEEALKESEEHLETVYDIIGTGIVLINAKNQIIIDVNKTAYELIGLPPHEIIGKQSHQFIFPNNKSQASVQDIQKKINSFECKLYCSNGEQKDIIKTVYPIKFKGIDCFLESFIEITQLVQKEIELELLTENLIETKVLIEDSLFEKNVLIEELSETKDKLEQINAEKDKFFSIIAHDLKSPFSGFLGLTKIMSEEIYDLSMREMQEFSKSMQESANNLYKLLENLLEWSRMQRGLINFNPLIYQLQKIVDKVFENQNVVAKQKEIILINSIREDTSVFADLPMLNTVFRNLISNAIKFTARGGEIEIGTKTNIHLNNDDIPDICIFVKDSGIGMNSDTISKLFKLDQKISHSGTEGEPSTGLGLLLCKEFIEKHKGTIWVESQEDIGSTFYFNLPKIN